MDDTNDITKEPAVNPTGEPPKATIGQIKTGNMPMPPPSGQKPKNKKKVLLLSLGAFGILIAIFLVLSFILVARAGTETSALAQLLGLNQVSFVNGLITLVHIFFILIALVGFMFVMIGLVTALKAPKEDKITKKKGLKTSLISGIVLMALLISWVFVYVYLDAKRLKLSPELTQPIFTEPADVINLTAPVEIRFDASNVPIDKSKFQIIFYEWDFGDGEKGTSQIVTHTFVKKGKFDVILSVTRRDKITGEEFKDQYSTAVTVAHQALTASFTATPQSGEAPLEVKFDASDSVDPEGEISSYEWDLNEDGAFDDEEGVNIEYEFEKLGRYTVALRVTSINGEFAIFEKEIIVEEAETPEAVITVVEEPDHYVAAFSYTFKADDSTSPNGDIVKYEWDFGDNTKKETTKTVSHSFLKEGTFEVKLKVIDEDEKEGETTKTITVGAPKGTPKAKISTDPEAEPGALGLEGRAPFQVVFTGIESTDSDNNIVDYEWDFDSDGETDEFGMSVANTFTTADTYTVRLKVTDADQNVGTATVTIKVLPKGIQADISVDKVEGTIPLTVKFDASGSSYDDGQITSYQWDFGDGTAPKLGESSITHKYTSVGSYTAKVTVIGSDNSQAIDEVLITVREIPLNACFTSVFEEGPAPLTTTFDPGCSTGTAADYFWDFGDGNTSTQVKPSHTFNTSGSYEVTLEITDADNTVDQSSLTITVTD